MVITFLPPGFKGILLAAPVQMRTMRTKMSAMAMGKKKPGAPAIARKSTAAIRARKTDDVDQLGISTANQLVYINRVYQQPINPIPVDIAIALGFCESKGHRSPLLITTCCHVELRWIRTRYLVSTKKCLRMVVILPFICQMIIHGNS